MKFIENMLSEGGKISHKRFISVTVALSILYGVLVVIHKYPDLIGEILWDAMIFVIIMSGVATVAQVASIVKGASSAISSKIPDEEKPKEENTKSE